MKLALSLVVAGFAALAPMGSSACTCIEVTLAQELAWSREIYTGTVIAIETLPSQPPWPIEYLLVTIRPDRVWRGSPVDDEFRVITSNSGASCGVYFQIGEEYLVFAHPDHPDLPPYSIASLCGRTHALRPLDWDVAALGPPLPGMALRASPNPAVGATTLIFGLPAAGRATLTIYDAGGRVVRTILDEAREAGPHAVAWDGRTSGGSRCPPGVYFVRLESAGRALTHRIVHIR